MDINLILDEIANKIPDIGKIIYQIKFENIKNDNEVAFLQGTTIFYTDRLVSDFSYEEQTFTIAHEIMHYLIHMKDRKKDVLKYDEDLSNFVEDAQINQLLIKLNFIAPKDAVLLEDALNYEFEDLYKKLLPIRKEILRDSNWSKYTSVKEILEITDGNKNAIIFPTHALKQALRDESTTFELIEEARKNEYTTREGLEGKSYGEQ